MMNMHREPAPIATVPTTPTGSNPTTRRERTRVPDRALLRAGVLLAGILLLAALVWILWPQLGPFASGWSPLEQLLGGTTAVVGRVAAGLLAVAAATTLTVGLGALTGRLHARGAGAVVTLVAVVIVALALLGFDGIVIAGYSFAFLIPLALIVLVGLLAFRRPGLALLLALPLVAIGVLAALRIFPVMDFYVRFLQTAGEQPARIGTALLLTGYVGIWSLWATGTLVRPGSRLSAFAARHRAGLAVAAAACGLPYVVARASWLTPWPLFGGSREAFAATPELLVVGLMLGTAILVAMILTLGLALAWGSRFPSWMPGWGGRPVPVALAVVPAAVVAMLFTAGGLQNLVLSLTGGLPPEVAIMLPFWLWGPLLALATWGYAEHRRQTAADAGRAGMSAAPHPPASAGISGAEA